MEKRESFIDIKLYRDRKQLLAEKNASALFSMVTDFAIRNLNIREKVRAKHLFRQQIHFQNEWSLPKYLEEIFDQWYLFDYHTIQGETIFSLFLKQQSSELSEPEMILGALFLTTYIEPFFVIEIDDDSGSLIGREMFENKQISVKMTEITDSQIGEYVFLRRLPLVIKDWVIGPVFPIESKEVITQIMNAFEQTKKVNPSLTWRSFLKRQGYFWIAQDHSRK